MPDEKISEFANVSILVGTEKLTGLQAGQNKNVTVDLIKRFIIGGKRFSFLLDTPSGGAITKLIDENGVGVTYTVANPSNGLITITSSSPVFDTVKTVMRGSAINNAGTAFFLTGVAFSTTVLSITIIRHDGTQVSTPSVFGILCEFTTFD